MSKIQVHEIHIDGSASSKEEAKEKIMKELDKIFGEDKKEEVKKEKEGKNKILLEMIESDERNGFGCKVEAEGYSEELMSMTVIGTAALLKNMQEQSNVSLRTLTVAFCTALTNEIINPSKAEEDEDED